MNLWTDPTFLSIKSKLDLVVEKLRPQTDADDGNESLIHLPPLVVLDEHNEALEGAWQRWSSFYSNAKEISAFFDARGDHLRRRS